MAFASHTLLEIKPRNLKGASLKTVTTANALLFIDDHGSLRQLGDGLDRTDAGAGRLYAVLTSPVNIVLLGAVLVVDEQVDHNPVVG